MADGLGAAEGDGDDEGDGLGDAWPPMVGRLAPGLLLKGAWSDGEASTSKPTAMPATAAMSTAPLTTCPRRFGRSPVFCDEARQARRCGVSGTVSAATAATGAER